ncbi:sigma-70 family RNA polymerase sigma factor [Pseudomonas silvicola]|uniref:sigma-70 family RNA polymerase sigma factor n=1 Tax=Pseudomonas sp. RIT-To-2 TaxID=3462541 RepID=UPI00227D55DA|nr:sigma-70 family RNA polymerase sigma factor [Pseudomonas silvicola]
MKAALVADDPVSLIFKDNYRWLCGRLQRSTGCRFDAEDIAGDTFVRVLKLPDVTAVREPRALLTTIAKRLMFESWRRRDLERAYLLSLSQCPVATHPSPEERAVLIDTLVTLDRVLDTLPGQGKAAFVHSQFGGMSYPQIAEHLGLSLSRVQQYMTEAFKLCFLATLE